MRSIVRQVVSTTLVAQVLLVACLVTVLLLHERSTRYRALDAVLQGRADSLAGAIQDAEDTDANVFVDPREFLPQRSDLYVVYGEDGQAIGSSSPAARDGLQRSGRSGWSDRRIDGVPYRVREMPAVRIIDRAETAGAGVRRPVTVLYATSERHLQHELAEATRFYVGAALLACGLVTALVTWSLRRSLRPLVDVAAAAEAIQAPPAMRFEPPASVLQVKELAALAGALRNAMERMKAAFDNEQRFVSDAAHELKTAVAVLRSSVQLLLLRPREPQEYAGGLERVLDDAGRMESAVRQMLQSAEVSEVLPAAQTSDLYAAAEEALAYVSPLAEARGVTLKLEGAPGSLAPVTAARARLLLENLVANAVLHSAPGAAVRVSVAHDEGGTRLTVSDCGHGISPAALPHVFDRFYREDASRSRDTGGTGLGLSICKSIVDAAAGEIVIHSTLGEGTTVHVTFTSV